MNSPRRRNQSVVSLAESFADSYQGNLAAAVLLGVVGAFGLGLYGLICLANQEALFLRGRPLQFVTWTGIPAICLGTAYLSTAIFLHAHFVWSGSLRFHFAAQCCKTLSAAGLAVSVSWLIIHVMVFM